MFNIDDIVFDDDLIEMFKDYEIQKKGSHPSQNQNGKGRPGSANRVLNGSNIEELYISVNDTGKTPEIELGRYDRNANWCTVKNVTNECIDAIIDYITVSSGSNETRKESQIVNPKNKKRYKLVLVEV